MTPLVVDGSALIEYLLRTELGDQVASIVEAPDADLHVPSACDVEVSAGLARIASDGDIDASRAEEALALHLALPLSRHGHQRLLPRVFELRDRFSSYDAAYVALCELLGATLITGDADLTRAARGHPSLNVIGVTG